ncbi:hypothetical protein WJX74_004398 [Apatococcus lobatus]|uniref:Uncharacterized protein n=1 Tax=Apatococcus lobatus TaxID=904363 RepID=A0AAW1SFD3_9CHLO
MNPVDDWTPRQEALLQEWSVKASGLRWLHTESASFYSLVADLVTIPTIVISTGAGITALKETCDKARDHKAAATDYSKLFRRIQAELTVDPVHRGPCLAVVTACRAEYDRLVSQGAPIPGFVISRYRRRFAEVHHKPEIVQVAVEELGETGTNPHEAVVPPPRRSVRLRTASTLLQDHIIDPEKAMRQAAPQVVIHPQRVSDPASEDGPPPGMRRAASPAGR